MSYEDCEQAMEAIPDDGDYHEVDPPFNVKATKDPFGPGEIHRVTEAMHTGKPEFVGIFQVACGTHPADDDTGYTIVDGPVTCKRCLKILGEE